jgi:DNA segregation ATPase FtsK/SpoIIIE-like protein
MTVTALDQHSEALAVAFGVSSVRVVGDPIRADLAKVALYLRPSLGPVAYPNYHRAVWLPTIGGSAVPLGLDESGDEVAVRLYGSSILVGGSPGAGKSTAIRSLLAGLAGHRDTALFGIDPKRVELTPWRSRFSTLAVGNEASPTLLLLTDLVSEVQRRAEVLAERGVLFTNPSPEMPAMVLVIDEWAELAAAGTNKERTEAHDLLRRFLSLGRAVGGSVIAATQRPTSDTVDTGTRALLAHRLALRCGDKWQSEAILGQGHGEAASIPLSSPGWGLLTSDNGVRGIQVYDPAPERIPDFTCAGLRIQWP